MKKLILNITEVKRSYPGKEGTVTAVQKADLSLTEGEFCALRGPSGCGKTTLLLIAGGLLKPESGKVEVNGNALYTTITSRSLPRFRAATIGFIFQQFYLVPYLTVTENILAPSVALGNKNGNSRARELAERFGLGHRLNHHPSQLSTGEKQRVALARALFNKPKLILADEPTGNLDESNANAVIDSLKEFAHDGGTVLLVTHDNKAASAAHYQIQMHNGIVKKTETTNGE